MSERKSRGGGRLSFDDEGPRNGANDEAGGGGGIGRRVDRGGGVDVDEEEEEEEEPSDGEDRTAEVEANRASFRAEVVVLPMRRDAMLK